MASRPTQAEPRPAPCLYLITPRLADPAGFAALLAAALGASDVAAVLLRLAAADEGTLSKRIKAIGTTTQGCGAALLLDGHPELVGRGRADGAHASGIAAVTETLEQLKPERIVGAGGLASRHDAMLAAEQGADYVMFGEPDENGARPTFAAVEERVAWWADIFECPCVGYAAGAAEVAPLVKAGADFIALGEWLWQSPDRVAALLADISRDLRLQETMA